MVLQTWISYTASRHTVWRAPMMCCSWWLASPLHSDLSLFLIEFFMYVLNTRSILSPLSPSFSTIDKTLTGASLEVMWSFLTLWRNWFHRSLNHSDLGVALLSHSYAQVVAKVALLVFCSNPSGMVSGPSSSRWDVVVPSLWYDQVCLVVQVPADETLLYHHCDTTKSV